MASVKVEYANGDKRVYDVDGFQLDPAGNLNLIEVSRVQRGQHGQPQATIVRAIAAGHWAEAYETSPRQNGREDGELAKPSVVEVAGN